MIHWIFELRGSMIATLPPQTSMMNTQDKMHKTMSFGRTQALHAGHPVAFGARAGRLEIVEGRVWLTRVGDLDDHMMEPGDSIELDGHAAALAEPWARDASAVVAWRHAEGAALALAKRLPRLLGLMSRG